ncbi:MULTISPECIES: YsgD/CorL family protein [Siccibacter]|nr:MULTISPECIES: YsgD/CorL family protein [Siccibacter]MDY0973169.1 YsgD/CorL family protein [Siccibacter turicensis]WNN50567.1 YsgD/CorL family protein [Siccibacter colletis]
MDTPSRYWLNLSSRNNS